MADIFISYSKTDAYIARTLAQDLEAYAFSTWWDASLVPGDMFSQEIMRELDNAKIVIVIWTKTSVMSKWVAAEASRALETGKLIPVRSNDLAFNDIPLPFNTLQTALLTDRSAILAAIERRDTQGKGGFADTPQHPQKSILNFATNRSDPALLVVAGSEWARLCQTDELFQLERFAEHFSGTYFSELARERIADLEARRRQADLEHRSRMIIQCPACNQTAFITGVVSERGVRGACRSCRQVVQFVPTPGTSPTQQGIPTEDGILVTATLPPDFHQTQLPSQNPLETQASTNSLEVSRRHYGSIFEARERLISAVALSQDGSLMAVGNREGDLSMFDISVGKRIWRASTHDFAISALSISHNNKFVVSGATNGRLVLWHTSTGKQYQEFEGHFDTAIKSACFDSNDHIIASTSSRTVRFWRFPGDEAIKALNPFGFTKAVAAISFALKESLFAACSEDGTVKLYETKTWRHLDSIKTGLSETFSTHMRFSKDGSTLMIAAGDCDGITPSNASVVSFDIGSKKCLFTASVQNVGEFCLVDRSCSLLCTQNGKIRLLSLPACNEEWSADTAEDSAMSVWATDDAATIATVDYHQDTGADHVVVWCQS